MFVFAAINKGFAMQYRYEPLSITLLFFMISGIGVAGENWPEFRGPGGQGHAGKMEIPIEWGESKNVTWKQPIPGKGWSSPILFEGQLFLTSAVIVDANDPTRQSMRVVCVVADTGTILWNREVFQKNVMGAHSKNSQASPTPITDGQRLYVHFGPYGTAALDFQGAIVWVNENNRFDPVHGNGGSPILSAGNLVFNCDGGDHAYVVALDRETGQTVWKTDRPAAESHTFSFSTPLEIEINGKKQIVSSGSHGVGSYDSVSGREVWRVRYPNRWSIVPRPVLAHGLVYVCTGFMGPASLLAIRPDGTGDVTDTHIAWQTDENVSKIPSPLVVGDNIYLVSDRGVATSRNAYTGELQWRQRLGGDFSASPLFANGKIYFQNEEGECIVIQAGFEYQELRRNQINETVQASFAVGDGAIYIRASEHLYRID